MTPRRTTLTDSERSDRRPRFTPESDDALGAAARLARDCGQYLSEFHAIAALCDCDTVRACLRALGIPAEQVVAVAQRGAESVASLPRIRLMPRTTTHAYDRALDRAATHVLISQQEEISAELLLLFFSIEPDDGSIRPDFERLGLTPAALRWYISHGERPDGLELPVAEFVALRLHNDGFTTREFVVDVLAEVVGVDDASAKELMLTIHHTGSEVVAIETRERVAKLFEEIRSRAKAKVFPLRMSAEPAEETKPSSDSDALVDLPSKSIGEGDLAWETLLDNRSLPADKYARWGVALVLGALLLELLLRLFP